MYMGLGAVCLIIALILPFLDYTQTVKLAHGNWVNITLINTNGMAYITAGWSAMFFMIACSMILVRKFKQERLENDKDFQPGDVMAANVIMTFEEINEGGKTAKCVWFDAEGQLQRSNHNISNLKHSEPNSEPINACGVNPNLKSSRTE